MFSTIPSVTPAEETDPLLEAIAHYIRQQHPRHRVVIEYSHEDNHFLKIYIPHIPPEQKPIYCYIDYENTAIVTIGKNFSTEIRVDLTNPHSIAKFDQALQQFMGI